MIPKFVAAMGRLRLSTPAIVAFLFSLAISGGVVIVGATHALESAIRQRVMARLDVDMKVAWRLLRDGGQGPEIVDGQLVAGGRVVNADHAVVDELQGLVGGVATIFQGDQRIATTVPLGDRGRAMDTQLLTGPARDVVLRDHVAFRGTTTIGGTSYFAAYDPILDRAGRPIGILFVGVKQGDVMQTVVAARNIVLAAAGGVLLLAGVAFFFVSRRLGRRIQQRERSLRLTNATLDTALNHMANGLCVWDARMRLVLANARFCQIYQLLPQQVAPGMTHEAFLVLRHAAGHFGDRPFAEIYAERRAAVIRPEPQSFQDRLSTGRVVSVVHRPTPGGGWTTTYEDVTERCVAQNQVAFMARHDALTQLPNRVLFHERMDEALSRGEGVAVLCLDLDRFKEVNDSLGHPVGDQLLCAVALRLLGCVRAGDTVARLGGDEFAIIQPGLTDSDALSHTAARIIDSVSQPYDIDGEMISIGISVGVGVAQPTGHDPEALLKQADLALYRAKAEGRATFRFFEPGMDAEVRARRALETELQRALVQEEFVVHYQPQVSLATGAVTGFEALLRWAHPTRGLIEPAAFIAVAEATGLIVPLGAWVLRRACTEAATWPANLRVAVNLSPVQFRDSNLVRKIRGTLIGCGLRPERLELEITESSLLLNTQATMAALHELIETGVQIALDDFGIGYSSLSYVRRFPVNKIKIDMSFIDGVGRCREADAIVRSIIGLARDLGVETLAEGVETMPQLAWLRAEGCDEAQGFLFSPARPGAEVANMLALVPPRFSHPSATLPVG